MGIPERNRPRTAVAAGVEAGLLLAFVRTWGPCDSHGAHRTCGRPGRCVPGRVPNQEASALVLVVDDDRLSRRLIASGVRREGHRSLEVESGEEALDLLGARSADPRAEGPDFVLLDILMPGIDGFEVLRQLKEAPRLRHLPVVVISSVEHTSEIARCIELGAEDFLPKPAEPAILRARLNAGLSKVRLHRIEQRRLRDSFARFVPEGAIGGVASADDRGRRGSVSIPEWALADTRK